MRNNMHISTNNRYKKHNKRKEKYNKRPKHSQRQQSYRSASMSTSDNRKRTLRIFGAVLCLSLSIISCSLWPVAQSIPRPFMELFLLTAIGSFVVFLIVVETAPRNTFSPIDASFDRSARKEPERPNTRRVSQARFKRLVGEAFASIPEVFHERMDNLVILVEDKPSRETAKHVGVKEGFILLGLYQGVPLTAQSSSFPSLPERITLYQHHIETYCHHDLERIRKQVRKTLLHELAHHFGMDHEDLPIWMKS